MKKTILLSAIIFIYFISCKKSNNQSSPVSQRMIGNWLVIGTGDLRDDNGIVVEWGLYYVNAVGIRADSSFTINKSPLPTGTWRLKDNESSIVFYSMIEDRGTIYKDTSEFKISIDANDQLILANGPISFRHKRLPN